VVIIAGQSGFTSTASFKARVSSNFALTWSNARIAARYLKQKKNYPAS
jgi:hypothetical protein